MTTKLYLDTRSVKDGELAPLKFSIGKNSKTAYIPLNIRLYERDWDRTTQKVLPSNKRYKILNSEIDNLRFDYDKRVREVANRNMTAIQIRDAVMSSMVPEELQHSLLTKIKEYSHECKASSTKRLYLDTYNKVRAYVREVTGGEDVSFEEVDKDWLQSFESWLETSGCKSQNTKTIHLRNIRAVFNSALDEELITCYPFRKFKIKRGPAKHRALTEEAFRELLNYPLRPNQVMPVDMFLLSFLLIGINAADLLDAEKSCIVGDRFEYVRKKTGKFYSIKIEPEAMAIIKKYSGKGKRLLNVKDADYNTNNFTSLIDVKLQHIGEWGMHPKSHVMACLKPLNDKLSWYWARHTWGTIASKLDIPKETISQAFGHTTNVVTNHYIVFERSKIDKANRKVIDYVLYNKT